MKVVIVLSLMLIVFVDFYRFQALQKPASPKTKKKPTINLSFPISIDRGRKKNGTV